MTLRAILLSATLLLPQIGQAQDADPMTFVVYEAGPAWDAAKAPTEQDLGAHFAYVADAVGAGTLHAFGLQSDAVRGFYLVTDPSLSDGFVAADPGAQSGVLSQADAINVALLVDAFPAIAEPTQATIFWYEPGPNWIEGRPLPDQDIADHVAYVSRRAAAGDVLAGGPLANGLGGVYIVTGNTIGFTEDDPGVTAGIFSPRATPWTILGAAPAR